MIAIVGGGIGGLALARELEARRCECMVLEAGSQPGGVIRSGVVEGRVLDWGPQRTRLTARIVRLIDALGLVPEVVAARADLPLLMYRQGRLRRVPLTIPDFLASDIVSWPARFRIFLEPFTAGARSRERVADYFTRKLGREIYDDLVGPLYGGLYASDPAEMEVGLSLEPLLRESGTGRSLVVRLLSVGGRISAPPACSFREGMQTLPLALARSLGSTLRVNATVSDLSRHGSRWHLELGAGTIEAEEVVITVAAPAAAMLLSTHVPDAAARIAGLHYNPLAIVHLHAETDLRALGFQTAFSERMALRGATFNAALFGRSGLCTAFLGGARHPDVATLDDGETGALAREQFRLCTGCDARVLSVARVRMPAWDLSWRAMEGLSLPPGIHLHTNWTGRPGLPARLADAERLATRLASGQAPAVNAVIAPRPSTFDLRPFIDHPAPPPPDKSTRPGKPGPLSG